MIRFFCLIAAGALTGAGVYAVAGDNAWGWVLALVFGPAYLVCVFQSRFAKARKIQLQHEQGQIWVKDGILVFSPPGELKQTFALADIEQIRIFTGDQAALFNEPFWQISAAGQTITVPADTAGEDKLLEALRLLPGFDEQRAVDAFSSTVQAEFILLDTKTGSIPPSA